MNDLVINRKTPLTDDQKTQLDQAVANWIEKHYSDLADKEDFSEELKKKNEELEEELNASEAANEVVESAVLVNDCLDLFIGKLQENAKKLIILLTWNTINSIIQNETI
jgi:exoribonuclease II